MAAHDRTRLIGSWPIVTFGVSATGSSAMTVVTASASVVINLASTSSGTYTLNYENRTLQDSVGASFANLYSGTPVFRPIASGGSNRLPHQHHGAK